MHERVTFEYEMNEPLGHQLAARCLQNVEFCFKNNFTRKI